MNCRYIAAASALAACLVVAAPYATSQTSDNQQLQPQGPSDARGGPAMAPQGEDNDATLELAPQPGALRGKVDELPGGRNFRPGQDTTSINPNFQPFDQGGGHDLTRPKPHGKPYLGIEVQMGSYCIDGVEESGFAIVNVTPNSPAARAGLRGQPVVSNAGAATATALGVLPGLNAVLERWMEKAGALGEQGDFIVGIDDERIHSQAEFDAKIAALKPGDTAYINIMRPVPGQQAKKMKIAVKVGDVSQPYADASAPPS
jgi:hypothetical protein